MSTYRKWKMDLLWIVWIRVPGPIGTVPYHTYQLSSGRRGSGESNLSLNSASDSPVPDTEAEHLMQMEEVCQMSSFYESFFGEFRNSLHAYERASSYFKSCDYWDEIFGPEEVRSDKIGTK